MSEGERRPGAVCFPGGGRPATAVRRATAADAVRRLTAEVMSDPTRAADQALLDGVVGLALAVPIYEADPGWPGAIADLFDDDGAVRGDGKGTGDIVAEIEGLAGSDQDILLDSIPLAQAWFRRAEGVTLRWGVAGAPTLATRKGVPPTELPAELGALVATLSAWRRPTDRQDGAALAVLVRRGLVWFTDAPQGRTLPGARPSAGPPAMRRAFQPVPLFLRAQGDSPRPLSFMPRVGETEGLELAGFEFRAKRRGKDVGGVVLVGDAAYARALRRLLPQLRGELPAEALLETLPEALRDPGALALRQMGEAGVLEAGADSAGEADRWLASDSGGARAAVQASWLGHASVALRFGDTHLWIDPVTAPVEHQGASAGQVQPPCWRGRPDLAALLITHGDNDHLFPPALCRVPPETPVLIPSMAGAGEWQVDIPGVLRVLQFDDVRPIEDWASVTLGDATVTAVPFEGEDWGLHQCSCTWLVEGLGRRVYLSADSAGTLAHAGRIRGERGIDLAFVGVSGNSEAHVMTPGFGYGNFYDGWIPAARAGRFIAHTDGPAGAAALAEAIGAREAFGYAASGVPWMGTAYSDEGDHAEMAACLQELGAACRPVEFAVGVAHDV